MSASRRLFSSRPALLRFWIAGLVSQLGDWLSYVAVSVLALDHGQGALAVAGVLVAHSLPHALLAPVGGVLADRFDRTRLLVWARLAQAGATLGLLVAAVDGQLAAVYGLLLVRTAIGALVLPAQQAVLPALAGPDGVLLANKLVSATWSGMFTVGMVLGGLLSSLGPTLALGLDVLSFLASAALLATLPRLRPAPGGSGTRRSFGPVLQRLAAQPALLRAVLGKAPLALASGGAWVLLNLEASALEGLAGAGLGLGLLQALRGVGTAIGPLLIGRGDGAGGEHPAAWLALDLALFAGIAGFTLSTSPLWLGISAAIWGAGTGANWVITNATQQRLAPDAMLGRASALDTAAFTALSCSGAVGGAWLADATGFAAAAAWGPLALGVVLWAGLRLWTLGPQASVGASSTAL